MGWALVLLLVVPIIDTRPASVQSAYERAHQLFLRGDLIRSQQEAQQGYDRFLNSNPQWAGRFLLLYAQDLIWRGMNQEALRVLAVKSAILNDKAAAIDKLSLEGAAYTYLSEFADADRKLTEAENLCETPIYPSCETVVLRRGNLALARGQFSHARQLFLESLSFDREHHDRRAETSALINLSATALQAEHYDEAVDWARASQRIAVESGWEDLTESGAGNLAWAYFGLGDKEKALEMFLTAANTAARLGNVRFEIKWLANVGLIYHDFGDAAKAVEVYQQSLGLAKQIGSQQDIVTSLEDLAFLSIDAGQIESAERYIDEAAPLISTSGDRLDQLDVMLAQGEIAAARRQDTQAETAFRTVEQDPATQTSMRLGAEHQIAKLYEAQNKVKAAESMYRTAITTFETARAELKNEDSKLPFLTNATPVYDDYIHLLVKQGHVEEALAAADQSRAQTLAQGLGLLTGKPSLKPAPLRVGAVAASRNATILFYWLGEKQSFLWAIMGKGTKLFPLPGERQITPLIDRYRKALLEPEIAADAATSDGEALYRMLVAPAADRIPPNGNVVIVCDGPLSLLNFETLLVPPQSPAATPHYWIDDANVVSAPSLYMLAAAKPPVAARNKLLLLGDAVSANPDYPELPMARAEMHKIESHFAPADQTVFARQSASAAAYLKSPLRNYAYIHFVAHGVASRTDPLDSAIILSSTGTAEDSFKLHARDIIQHPIDARLVTISACYGGGTRSYAGEGLVGLSWAFLRAGAHNVIGALWDASDDSTPQLMDRLYAGLAAGMSPSAALRQAKLALLHSEGRFQGPFYWAPFQIYAGL